jgi:DNA replication and repair protein RecF
LTRLALTDFRSYSEADVTMEPGVTTFSGQNGEGKTNLVEAVGYVATLGSHRVSGDAPLVRSGAERAVIRAVITGDSRDTLVEIEVNPGRTNRVRLNRAPVTKPREILGVLHTVLFAPEDLALVKGDPSDRRRFLDDLLVAMAPRYAAVRSDYERVLKQRAALLKSAGVKGAARGAAARQGSGEGRWAGASTLDVWDAHLAKAGTELLTARERLVDSLRPHVEKSYDEVSGSGGPAGLVYRRSFEGAGDAEEAMRAALLAARPSELERGVCLVGPHRDELELRIRDLPARGYASHGESWSLALALRLASFELLRADREDPVLILDDVFAELDDGRRNRLAELVAGAEQVLVTAAVPADVPPLLTGVRYSVTRGGLTRAGCHAG